MTPTPPPPPPPVPKIRAPDAQRVYYQRLEANFREKERLLDDFLHHFRPDGEVVPDLPAFAGRLIDGTSILPLAGPGREGGRVAVPPAAIRLERKVIWQESQLVTLCDYVGQHYDQLKYSFQRKVGGLGQAYDACKEAVEKHTVPPAHRPLIRGYVNVIDAWLEAGGKQSVGALHRELLAPLNDLIEEYADNPFAQTMARDGVMAEHLHGQMKRLLGSVDDSLRRLRDLYGVVALMAGGVSYTLPPATTILDAGMRDAQTTPPTHAEATRAAAMTDILPIGEEGLPDLRVPEMSASGITTNEPPPLVTVPRADTPATEFPEATTPGPEDPAQFPLDASAPTRENSARPTVKEETKRARTPAWLPYALLVFLSLALLGCGWLIGKKGMGDRGDEELSPSGRNTTATAPPSTIADGTAPAVTSKERTPPPSTTTPVTGPPIGDPLEPVYGVDVSHHNGRVDWEALLAATRTPRVQFAVIKATEGITVPDERFDENWRAVLASPLRGLAAYHFLTASDPARQAEHFIRTVTSVPHDKIFFPVVDVEGKFARQLEREGKLDRHLREVVDALAAAFHRPVVIYCGPDLHQRLRTKFPDADFWIAHWCYSTKFRRNGRCFTTYDHLVKDLRGNSPDAGRVVAWQFTDDGRVEGLPHNVDLSVIPALFWAEAAGYATDSLRRQPSGIDYRTTPRVRRVLTNGALEGR